MKLYYGEKINGPRMEWMKANVKIVKRYKKTPDFKIKIKEIKNCTLYFKNIII